MSQRYKPEALQSAIETTDMRFYRGLRSSHDLDMSLMVCVCCTYTFALLHFRGYHVLQQYY